MKYAIAVLLVLIACAQTASMNTFHTVDGTDVGTVNINGNEDGVILSIQLHGLPPGTHALHVHENPVCEGDFSTAGGHFNPEGKQHGRKNPQGFHAGDLPNIEVMEDGIASVELIVSSVVVGDAPNSIEGHSLVIHEGPDDDMTDPSGDAGKRIACAVIVH